MTNKQFRMLMTVLFAIADVLVFGGTKGRATILLAIDDFKSWEERTELLEREIARELTDV